jgi:hypothetical protein
MLKGVNDSDADARELVRLLKGIPAKINLIPFNPWPGSKYECSDWERIERFSEIVYRAGYASPVRTPRGRDILAACASSNPRPKSWRARARLMAEERHRGGGDVCDGGWGVGAAERASQTTGAGSVSGNPSGKNRAFGVYDLYDVMDEIAEAKDALRRSRSWPALDASMSAYVDAYSALARSSDEANTYYERKDISTTTSRAAATATFGSCRPPRPFWRPARRSSGILQVRDRPSLGASSPRASGARGARRIGTAALDDGGPARRRPAAGQREARRRYRRCRRPTWPRTSTPRRNSRPTRRRTRKPSRAFRAAPPRSSPPRAIFATRSRPRRAMQRADGQPLQRLVNAYNALAGSANNAD